MIYEYGVTDALADAIVKTPVVYQPDIRTVQLTYTDARTGEKRRVEEIDWEEVDRLGLNATQWVTDDEPMRQQMAIALRRLEPEEVWHARRMGREHRLGDRGGEPGGVTALAAWDLERPWDHARVAFKELMNGGLCGVGL